MASDQQLAELINDPKTKLFQDKQLKIWMDIKADHEAFKESAEKHGSSEAAAETAADIAMRGRINLFVGGLLPHTREIRALGFIASGPKEWGARSELLLDVDPLVPELIAGSFPIVAWNVKSDPISKAVAYDSKRWRAWLLACLYKLGAGKLAAQVVGEMSDGKPPPGPKLAPNPKPSAPTPPTPPATSHWRTALVAGAGVIAGVAVIGGTIALVRRSKHHEGFYDAENDLRRPKRRGGEA
jgi:hypothetical protein